MNLRSLDLNLLVILDALLDEAHVSRAADRLGLSQPAASAALQRCRHLFRDELLERGRGTMRLTQRAESLRAPLKSVLAGVIDLVDPPELPLADIRQRIRLVMADYPATVVTGLLHRSLADTAPGIDLVIQPWHGAEAAKIALVEGSTDLAVSVFPHEEADIRREKVLTEHYVTTLRPGHPAIDDFDLDRWLAWPHVLVSGRGETRSALDGELARIGRIRRVGLVVPSFGMVPDLLRGSDMIALLPSRVMAAATDLVALPTPIEIAGFDLHVAWHQRRAKDGAVQHVAALLEAALR